MSIIHEMATSIEKGFFFHLPEILAIAPAFILGLLLTRQDIRHHKASNFITFSLMGLGLAVQAFLIFYYEAGTWRDLGVIFGSALGIGFLLFLLNIWPPGDAKGFAGFSLVLPLSMTGTSGPFFLIINTFIVYFLFILTCTIRQLPWKGWFVQREKWVPAFKVETILTSLKVSIYLLFFIGFAYVLNSLLPFDPGYFGFLALFVTAYILFEKIPQRLRKGVILALVIPIAALIFMDWQAFLRLAGPTVVFVLLGRYLLLKLFWQTLTQEVAVQALHPGMLPADYLYVDASGTVTVRPQNLWSLLPGTQFASREWQMLINVNERLNDAQIAQLAELNKEGHLSTFRIQKIFPFVPVLYIGWLVTLIFRDIFLISAVQKLLPLIH